MWHRAEETAGAGSEAEAEVRAEAWGMGRGGKKMDDTHCGGGVWESRRAGRHKLLRRHPRVCEMEVKNVGLWCA